MAVEGIVMAVHTTTVIHFSVKCFFLLKKRSANRQNAPTPEHTYL